MDIMVAVAAMPIAIASFAKNEVPGRLVSTSETSSISSPTSSTPFGGVTPEVEALTLSTFWCWMFLCLFKKQMLVIAAPRFKRCTKLNWSEYFESIDVTNSKREWLFALWMPRAYFANGNSSQFYQDADLSVHIIESITNEMYMKPHQTSLFRTVCKKRSGKNYKKVTTPTLLFPLFCLFFLP